MGSSEYEPQRSYMEWQGVATGVAQRVAGEWLAAGLPLNARPVGYVNALVVKSGPGTLFGFSGYNSKGSGQFILVFDTPSVPANGAIPEMVITVPTVTNFSAAFVIPGRSFTQGIVICNSSTGPTLTIGSADCWIDAQYI